MLLYSGCLCLGPNLLPYRGSAFSQQRNLSFVARLLYRRNGETQQIMGRGQRMTVGH